jgi:tRNA G46 methylase TrmB
MFEKISQLLLASKKVDRQHTNAAERSYYLTAGNAIEFDERSGLTSNMERHDDISKRIRRVLDSGMLLDIGYGMAWVLIAVAEAIPELKLVGIDVSEAMIDIGMSTVCGRSERVQSRLTLRSREDRSRASETIQRIS